MVLVLLVCHSHASAGGVTVLMVVVGRHRLPPKVLSCMSTELLLRQASQSLKLGLAAILRYMLAVLDMCVTLHGRTKKPFLACPEVHKGTPSMLTWEDPGFTCVKQAPVADVPGVRH